MSKYDWNFIPEHIRYAVIDCMGRQLGFIEKPNNHDEYCIMHADYLISDYVIYAPMWKDSLEERPK